MYVKIQTSELSNGNSGSCRDLAYYLEKENLNKPIAQREFFFSQTRERVYVEEVIETIDKNGKGGLKKDEAKFYSLVFALSQNELEHIANSSEQLKAYTRKAMEAYAENFNRGLKAEDLVWFAKIEHSRGDEKEGLQTHIHVIVSRKTADKKMMISPLANERGKTYQLGDKVMVKGFDRDKYKQTCETLFDKLFSYQRPKEESYQFFKDKDKLSILEKAALEKEIANKKLQEELARQEALKQAEKEEKEKMLKNKQREMMRKRIEESRKIVERTIKKRYKNNQKVSLS